jgi:steroid 5-alpha reductase family enzyme
MNNNNFMTFSDIYLQGLGVIMILMSLLWIISILMKNVSIVDYFWGLGFVIVSTLYFITSSGNVTRKILILVLVAIWGLRLSGYLAWRNYGKGEDFRYREFRKKYGEKRYWWISFFQVFLLQGILMWLISAPLLGAQFYGSEKGPGILDILGIILWITGLVFEAGGDYQLAAFKADPSNKGKVLNRGLWRYTRHPNYFGDSSVWWGYGFICLSAGSYLPVLGAVLMTILIIRVSGVVLLEKSLVKQRPEYEEYIKNTSAFIPWFPKKIKNL